MIEPVGNRAGDRGPGIPSLATLGPTTGQQLLAQTKSESWGALPAVALIGACGLLIVAIADLAARRGQGFAEPLFWTGLVCLYLPVTLRLVWPTLGRREGFGLVLLLGLGLYLIKVMHSPLVFTFPDEFSHWRTADDIIRSGGLFQRNPLLPVSALYPGLETITAALVSLGGTSIFHAGIAVVGAARLLMVMSLYAIFDRISRSPRVAGIATVIYMANPNYLFFSAGFDYESLSLPAAALAILASIHREEVSRAARPGWTVVALLMLGLVVTTHHLTSYALSAFLLLWLATSRWCREEHGQRQGPGIIAVAALIASLLWLLTVGSAVLDYLGPRLSGALGELVGMGAGESGAGRVLFESTSGHVAPLWEQLTGIVSVGLVLAGLPFGLLLLWRVHRDRAIALALAIAALTYPLSPLLRFTRQGWEIGNRLPDFVFVGVAFVLALAVVALLRREQSPPGRGAINRAPTGDTPRPRTGPLIARCLVALCITVVFAGGVIAGWTPAWRLPASQIEGADLSPADPEAIAAAQWARAYLGPDNHVAAERNIPMKLMGSYGQQDIETTLSGGANADWIILTPQVDSDLIDSLRKGRVEYVVIDRRPGASVPGSSSYFPGVPRERGYAKFERLKVVSRVFDSGGVQVYDVRMLTATGETANAQ